MQSKKQRIIHRIKIIKGHLNAIEKMVNEDKYCIDVVHQSLAVQKALKNLDMELMKGHIENCVVTQAMEGKTQKVIDELVSIYKYK